jgi:2'-hydroxyisoflavone reductase
MKLLLFGGYTFLGRAIIDVAQECGHTVTAFNRGNIQPPPDVEAIRGDRKDPSVLRGRCWDAVIDTSGYIPRHVQAALEALGDGVGTYVFVSTLSVYADPIPYGCDESAPRNVLAGGTDPNTPVTSETYGAQKALCEDALEAALPGRNVAVRAGFIVGPHDYSDRFNSWVERAARGDRFLLPGAWNAPLQMIDVRDLAAWIVGAAEARLCGPYNVTTPPYGYNALDVARACVAGTGSRAEVVVVDSETVKTAGLVPWEHIPFWMEPAEYALMRVSVERALATGLRMRPLVDTVRDTYAWLRTSDHIRRIICPPGLERAVM